MLVEVPRGAKVVVTEADLDDYPGLRVTGTPDSGTGLRALSPPTPWRRR